MNAPTTLRPGQGECDASPSVVSPCPEPAFSHDPWGDLETLTRAGDLADVRLTASAHKDPAKRVFTLRGETRRRTVCVVGPDLTRCAERLVEMAEVDAVHERLVADVEPLLSAERDSREAEAAE